MFCTKLFWITCTGGKDFKNSGEVTARIERNRELKRGCWVQYNDNRSSQNGVSHLCRINIHLWASPSLITWSRHFISIFRGKADAVLLMCRTFPKHLQKGTGGYFSQFLIFTSVSRRKIIKKVIRTETFSSLNVVSIFSNLFLSLCVCGPTNKPIMYKKFDNMWAAGR